MPANPCFFFSKMSTIEQPFQKDSSSTTLVDTDKSIIVDCKQEALELSIQEVTQQEQEEQQDDEDDDEEVETVNKKKTSKNGVWSIKKKISILVLSVLIIIIVYQVYTMERYPIVYEKKFSLDSREIPIIPKSFLNVIRKDLGLLADANVLMYITDFRFGGSSIEEDDVAQSDDSQLFKKNLLYKNVFEILLKNYDARDDGFDVYIADDVVVGLDDDFDADVVNAAADKNEDKVWRSIIKNNFVTLASIFIKLGYNVNKEFIVRETLKSESFTMSLLQMCVDYGNIDIAYELLKHNADPAKIDAAFPDEIGRLTYDPVRYLIYSYRFESPKRFDFL